MINQVEARKLDLSHSIVSFKRLYSHITGENIGDNSLDDVVFKAMIIKEINNNLDNFDYRKGHFEEIQECLQNFNQYQIQKNKNVRNLFKIGVTICVTLNYYEDVVHKNKSLTEILKKETDNLEKKMLSNGDLYKDMDYSDYLTLLKKYSTNSFSEEDKGMFITQSPDGNYIAIDNTSGYMNTKRFTEEKNAINFLNNIYISKNSIEADYKVENTENADESEEDEDER